MVSGEHQPLSPAELEGRWNSFFEETDLRRRIVQIAESFPKERSLGVSFHDIDERDSALADNLLNSPEATLKAGEKALIDLLPEHLVPPTSIHLRVTGLPLSSRIVVHDLRQSHLNQFVAIEGIIRRMTEVRPQIVDAVFECAACRDRVGVEQEEGAPNIKEPVKCDSCGKPLGKTRFTLVPEASRYIDSQKIEIQENPEKLKGGTHPEGLPVILLEDLTGGLVPGHRLIINGRLRSTPRLGGMKGAGRPAVFDLTLLANSIEREDREYAEIEITVEDRQAIESMRGDKNLFSRFVDSLAPSIQGMRVEKEAIALQLFGGVPKEQPDGIHIRGDIHALLVGDPGTAKSQLLRYVADIAPRGIYTSGKGSSAAGLTAAAVKDDFGGGKWTLEAGAMVLADMGQIMIDELDKMSPNDRSSIHEAMEQQSVSIAKAGITSTLKARCPVLAAANPKLGRFSGDKTPAEEIDLPPTLLSRFDIIFALEDKPDAERDRSRAGAILDMHVEAEEREAARSLRPEATAKAKRTSDNFEPGFMRKYVAYAKQHVFPVMEPGANKMLLDFFVNLRKEGEGEHKPVPITLRQVEGLVRLTEASARARLSPVATVEDAERAINIVQHFLKTVVQSGSGLLDIDYITVGTPSSYRDKIGIIRDIMRKLQEGTPEGFTVEEVIEKARDKNIPKNEAQRLIHEIERLNEVYSPKTGKLKLME